jgi:hypothetical protein
MSEFYMDILSKDGRLDACNVVLLPSDRHGAMPTIERISAEQFFITLHSGLAWRRETTDLIRHKLEQNGKATNESLGSPSIEQLRRLGFEGLDTEK